MFHSYNNIFNIIYIYSIIRTYFKQYAAQLNSVSVRKYGGHSLVVSCLSCYLRTECYLIVKLKLIND